MATEKRKYPRITVKGITANITITEPNGSIIIVEANILDISRSGIRLGLLKPLPSRLNELIELEIILPGSGAPLIISASIVQRKSEGEFGANYVDLRPEDPIDQLLEDCKLLT